MRIITSVPDICRMLLGQHSYFRRAVFGWRRRKSGLNRGFWATSGDDSRALFEEFAAIQHYIRGDKGSFFKSLRIARGYAGSEPANISRTGLLLDVLEANQLVRDGETEAAVDCYTRRLTCERRSYRAMLRRRQRCDVRRGLLEQHQILGLLELNFAELLRRAHAPFSEVEKHYQQACTYLPSSTFAHSCYAQFLVSRRRWEHAIEKFREAYAEGGLDDTSSVRNSNLAWAYIEWARWRNRPRRWLNRPRKTGALAHAALHVDRERSARKARKLRLPGTSALEPLDEALRELKMTRVPVWEGAIHFEWASILASENLPERAKDVSDAFLASAHRYSDGHEPEGSASAFERAGDVLCARGLVRDALAVYEDGLKQADSIACKEGGEKQRKRNTVDRLLSRLAITRLGVGDKRGTDSLFGRLREQWWAGGGENARWGAEDWGPYYDAQALSEPLLVRADLRHSLTTYYHWLLANASSKDVQYLKDARDITSALFALYRLAGQETKGRTDDPEVLGGASETADPLNVVTPLAVEIGEDLANVLETEDARVQRSPTFLVDDFKNLGSLASKLKQPRRRHIDRYLADQLSPEAQNAVESYKHSVSDPMPLQMALLQVLARIVEGLAIYDAQRFADIDLRWETKELLAKKPDGEDLRRLNALLLEDAYSQELSRNALGRYAGSMRRRIEAKFGVRVPGIRVRSSPELKGDDYRLLIQELVVGGGSCGDQRLDEVFLHLETVCAANLAEFLGHQETQNYLERNELVVPTVEDVSEKEHCSHIDPLTAVLRALVTERVPLTEPKATYEVFRSGWKQGIGIATIVERIRRIPKVEAGLWGNDGEYAYVLLSLAVESLVASATRTSDHSDYLVMKESDRTRILAAIEAAIAGRGRPALIVRRQEQRALVRQLIAPRYPDVPVLSASEVHSNAEQIAEMPELDFQGPES